MTATLRRRWWLVWFVFAIILTAAAFLLDASAQSWFTEIQMAIFAATVLACAAAGLANRAVRRAAPVLFHEWQDEKTGNGASQ